MILMAYISFTDSVLGGETNFCFKIKFEEKTISARELIISRVENEVKKAESKKEGSYLVKPTSLEKVLKKPLKIDREKQKELALKAFQGNGFLLFVNDSQITSLDELISVEKGLDVKFLKLIPLVGG